jgi:hypothetical protein
VLSEDPIVVQSGAERRRYRRVATGAEVHCEALERNEVMLTRNISIEGMFIVAKFPLPAESELAITFRLYPAEPPITCSAKVIYSRVGVGMGIKFVDLSSESLQEIQKFINEVG